MGLFSTAIALGRERFKNDLSLTDPKAWNPLFWNLLAAQTSSGAKVSEETALTYSAVFCAVNLLAGTVSTLPLRLLREKDRRKLVATQKPAHLVVHTRWNRYMTAQIGREVLAAHVLLWGNGYAEKVYNGMGDLVELWPIPPNKVKPRLEDGELLYDITVGAEIKTLTRAQILHIPGLGFDGFVGYSVVSLARESIGLGMAMEQFGARYFGSGTHPGVIVSHPGKLTEQAHSNLQRSLVEKYSGLGNAHRLLLLEEGMSIANVGVPPEDSQFLESRQFQIPEIARWFNLPPHKLKDLTRSSFNNIESEQISFVIESVLPWLVRFETNFNLQLLTDRELKQGYYFKHNVEGLLRGNADARGKLYQVLFGVGAMSPDDIRDKEDLDPLPEGTGNRYFVPLNMIPLDKVDENLEQKQEQSQPQPGKQAPEEKGGKNQ